MDMSEFAKKFIVCSVNIQNKARFKAGGIGMPEFKNYDEMMAFIKLIEEAFPCAPAGIKFSDLDNKSDIVFNIDEKYR